MGNYPHNTALHMKDQEPKTFENGKQIYGGMNDFLEEVNRRLGGYYSGEVISVESAMAMLEYYVNQRIGEFADEQYRIVEKKVKELDSKKAYTLIAYGALAEIERANDKILKRKGNT